ncbi:hypothetical protein mvi_35210 [Methylobacterium indicum]|uniref:Uncharacterized protein n=1 Tax=Methylobacterium indicum TaxID=1775910 RepID=A0A8H8WUX0_9HYPH|nr:hypothetical protein mvi_35210 [Methylobacterium indicum]
MRVGLAVTGGLLADFLRATALRRAGGRTGSGVASDGRIEAGSGGAAREEPRRRQRMAAE